MEIGEYYLHNSHKAKWDSRHTGAWDSRHTGAWDSRHTGDIWVCVKLPGKGSKHPALKVVSTLVSSYTNPYINHPAHLEVNCLEKI
jgi:hypothetical protein